MKKETSIKWAIAIGVMILVQCISMTRNYNQLVAGGMGVSYTLGLNSSLQQWMSDLGGADSASYLTIAKNIADGHGVNFWCAECKPPQFVPWSVWTPGAPFAFSLCIRLARWLGVSEMHVIFYAWNLIELIVGFVILLILWQLTQNLWAMILTAVFCAWCPAVQHWYYGWSMVNSEFATQIPLALFFLFLTKSYLSYWREESRSKIFRNFALTGVFLGLSACARSSLLTFAPFFIVVSALLFWLKRKQTPTLKIGFMALAAFYIGCQVFPTCVKLWNYKRIGHFTLSTGHSWMNVFWQPHNSISFVIDTGLGIGDYLDPAKAAKLRETYPSPSNSVLFFEYFKSLLSHPIKAIIFKLKRIPMLFFNTAPFPRAELNPVGMYSLFFYITFVVLLVMLWRTGIMPPEILYVYLGFFLCAAVIIHFEYRYTNPLWIPFRIMPGLLLATLLYYWRQDKSALAIRDVYARS